MGIKFLAIAFVAFLSLQGCVEAKHISLDNERGLVEDIEKVFEAIKESVQKLIVEAVESVKKAIEAVVAATEEEVEKAIAQIQENLKTVLEQIQEFEQKAIELGKEAQECVVAQKGRLQDLVTKTAAGVHECVAGMKADVQKHADELIAAASDAFTTIQDMAQQFHACGNLACRVEVTKKMVAASKEIGGKVRGIVSAAISDTAEKLPIAVGCIEDQVHAYTSEVRAILTDVEQCILAAGDDVKTISSQSIVDDVKKLIEDLKKAVNDIVNNGLAALNEAKEKVKQMIQDALNKLTEAANAIKAEIEEMKKKAEELGQHAVECVNAAAETVDVLVADSQKKMDACNQAAAARVAAIVQKVADHIESVKKDLVDIDQTHKSCKPVDPLCWISVAAKASSLMSRVTVEVPKLIVESKAEIAQTVVELSACGAPIAADYAKGMDNIRKEVGKCLVS